MDPSFSVIFFTVVSGAGYGIVFLIGIAFATNVHAMRFNDAVIALVLGTAFAAAGLTSSMLHLGQPLRAWRAFSQWRSSWLSREGVASMASFVPIGALGLVLWRHDDAMTIRLCGGLLAICAVVTVCCTAKIYTTLKTIQAWHNGFVLPGYLLFALLGGSAFSWAIDELLATPHNAMLPMLTAIAAVCCANLKVFYWHYIDIGACASTRESATGLGRFGAVTSAEGPHTEENYLTREMGFVLARKHSKRLRLICIVMIGFVPLAMSATWNLSTSHAMQTVSACIAAISIIAGTFIERWLFFAEAKHVVMLYYGRSVTRSA